MERALYTRADHEYERVEALSSDTYDPMPTKVLNGELHVITFLDLAMRFAAEISIRSRMEVQTLIDVTVSNLKRDFGWTLKVFVSDYAPEYLSEDVFQLLEENVCKQFPTSSYSPDEKTVWWRVSTKRETPRYRQNFKKPSSRTNSSRYCYEM